MQTNLEQPKNETTDPDRRRSDRVSHQSDKITHIVHWQCVQLDYELSNFDVKCVS
jgi:hypothetical protein